MVNKVTSMSGKTAVVPLAPGFEELEAITIIDVLRRAEVAVCIVSTVADRLEVESAHNVVVRADRQMSDLDWSRIDLLALPGGMPGSRNLADNPHLLQAIRSLAARNAWLAAVCAAPMALHAAGVLAGKRATIYPGFEKDLPGVQWTAARVEVDGYVVTGQGPGPALEFALRLVSEAVDSDRAADLATRMLVR